MRIPKILILLILSLSNIAIGGSYFLPEPDLKAREIPKTTKEINGRLSEEEIRLFGEFLGTEFKTEMYHITDIQKGSMVPAVFVTTIPSTKKGVNYNVRFWNHYAPTSLSPNAVDRVEMNMWVDDIPSSSFSIEIWKVVEYEFNGIWLIFNSANGQSIVITKHHPSDKNHQWITSKVDGFSISVNSTRFD